MACFADRIASGWKLNVGFSLVCCLPVLSSEIPWISVRLPTKTSTVFFLYFVAYSHQLDCHSGYGSSLSSSVKKMFSCFFLGAINV